MLWHPALSRVYGLHPWMVADVTGGELDRLNADLTGAG